MSARKESSDKPLTSEFGWRGRIFKDIHQPYCFVVLCWKPNRSRFTKCTKRHKRTIDWCFFPTAVCHFTRSSFNYWVFRAESHQGEENPSSVWVDERNWWHEAFYFKSFLFILLASFCWFFDERAFDVVLFFFVLFSLFTSHQRGLLQGAKHTAITKRGFRRFICLRPILNHIDVVKLSSSIRPFFPIK